MMSSQDSALTDPVVVCKPILVEQTLRLRHIVLWPDKPVSHVCLPEDDVGIHLGAFVPDNDEPVAVISLFIETLPQEIDAISDRNPRHHMRFRKFACDPAFQGRGIGTKLLLYSFEHARSQCQSTVIWCDARKSTADWYAKRGMKRFGIPFFKGTVEYIRMYVDVITQTSY